MSVNEQKKTADCGCSKYNYTKLHTWIKTGDLKFAAVTIPDGWSVPRLLWRGEKATDLQQQNIEHCRGLCINPQRPHSGGTLCKTAQDGINIFFAHLEHRFGGP